MRSKSRPRPEYPPGYPKKILAYSDLMPEKFWDAVEINYTSGCWEWEQATMRFRQNGKSRAVRPWVSEVFLGFQASFSKCGNAKCVNPAHLVTEYACDEQAKLPDDYGLHLDRWGSRYRTGRR